LFFYFFAKKPLRVLGAFVVKISSQSPQNITATKVGGFLRRNKILFAVSGFAIFFQEHRVLAAISLKICGCKA